MHNLEINLSFFNLRNCNESLLAYVYIIWTTHTFKYNPGKYMNSVLVWQTNASSRISSVIVKIMKPRTASLILHRVMIKLSKAIYWPKNGKWKMRGSVLYKWLMNWILISYLMINLSCFLINTHPHGIFRGHLCYCFQNIGKWVLVNRSKNTRPCRISWGAQNLASPLFFLFQDFAKCHGIQLLIIHYFLNMQLHVFLVTDLIANVRVSLM